MFCYVLFAFILFPSSRGECLILPRASGGSEGSFLTNLLTLCQGVYTFDEKNRAIKVDTFCVHGSPTGYITGIRAKVQCVTDEELSKVQTNFERMQMVQQKCFLKFPSLPFIPRQPYNVLNTDYDNFALVSGAKDASFVQVQYKRSQLLSSV